MPSLPTAIPGPIDWQGLLLLLGIGAAAYWALLVLLTAWRLTHPPRRTYAWAVSRGVPGDPREAFGGGFTSSDRRLDGGAPVAVWEVEGEAPAGPVVIISHGWGSGRVEMLRRSHALRAVASRVVLWDMPGHGESGGWCTLGDREERVLGTLIDDASERFGVPVVLHGWSLGAEISIRAARTRPAVRGIVLDGVYTSGWVPARCLLESRRLPWGATLGPALALIGLLFGFDPLRRFRPVLRGVDASALPGLLLHASRDVICPVQGASEIARDTGWQLRTYDDAGHDDVWVHAESEALEWIRGLK